MLQEYLLPDFGTSHPVCSALGMGMRSALRSQTVATKNYPNTSSYLFLNRLTKLLGADTSMLVDYEYTAARVDFTLPKCQVYQQLWTIQTHFDMSCRSLVVGR